MQRYVCFIAAVLAVAAPRLDAQMSTGNYRVPYNDGTDTRVLDDHLTHPLTNRVDLRGTNNNPAVYSIRAAAAGTVRVIRDNSPPGCVGCANYVWIEHPNGEWTGYFYLQTGSVTTNAGLRVDDPVSVNQFIGLEGSVGSPAGPRLRFEVGVPTNPEAPVVPSNGMLVGLNRIPVICNIPNNVFIRGKLYTGAPCGAFEFSYGTYRLPYSNTVTLKVLNDHLTHSPNKTRYDLTGQGGVGANPTYPVVAAAAGTVMWIVDSNTVTCGTCSAANNYVWIRHSNGEWTKYTHFITGSVTAKAKLVVGMNVAAGRYLGDEGNIGAATVDHLHFEVAVPDNGHLYTNAFQTNITDAFQVSGGFINGINRIPLFCGVGGNILFEDDVVIAGNCGGGNCLDELVVPAKIIRGTDAHVAANTVDTANNNISLDTYASLALLAGNKVTLRPGFKALSGSYLRAAIQPCFNAP